jgi:pSer/pThr/pTyr-binding forkhead associated (FHA) protein
MCDAQQTRHPVRIPNLKIGRGQHNDFVLRNDSISGNHCVLDCNREGEWSITDLNSGNGVVLNGTQVRQATLRQGDTIELGELKMRFLLRA